MCKMRLLPYIAAACFAASLVRADVFHMGPGLTSIDFVTVGNPGNAPDTRYDESGIGSVTNSYRIGTTEITNAEYAEFLNAVAAADPYRLYTPEVATDTRVGIIRSGGPGGFVYTVKPDAIGKGFGGSNYSYANKPVVVISWASALRFVNWLQNGQGGPSTTEYGAYTLTGAKPFPTNFQTIVRDPAARYWLPNDNEWYKAAYYDANKGRYYDYPTGTDELPNNNYPSSDSGNSVNFAGTETYEYPMTDVGAYSKSRSLYGTLDQGGNADEWMEPVADTFAARGGNWNSVVYDVSANSYTSVYPDIFNQSIGFRIAASASPLRPGDYNQNGIIDAADYTIWRDQLDESGPGLAADGNGDGVVNLQDYFLWRENFLMPPGSASRRGIAVPEPSTTALLVIGCVVVLVVRRR